MRSLPIRASRWAGVRRNEGTGWRNPSAGSSDDQSRWLTICAGEGRSAGLKPGLYKASRIALTILLELVAGTGVVRIKRLAAGKAFVLAMIKADAVFAELPAQIDILIIDDCRKVEQTYIQVLDDTAGFEDAAQRGLQGFRKIRVLCTQPGELFVRHQHAPHHHDAGGNGGKIIFQCGKFFSAVNGLDEKGLQVFAHTFGFREREKALRRLWSFVLLGIVVLVGHEVR